VPHISENYRNNTLFYGGVAGYNRLSFPFFWVRQYRYFIERHKIREWKNSAIFYHPAAGREDPRIKYQIPEIDRVSSIRPKTIGTGIIFRGRY
jgi:hypothetical protein